MIAVLPSRSSDMSASFAFGTSMGALTTWSDHASDSRHPTERGVGASAPEVAPPVVVDDFDATLAENVQAGRIAIRLSVIDARDVGVDDHLGAHHARRSANEHHLARQLGAGLDQTVLLRMKTAAISRLMRSGTCSGCVAGSGVAIFFRLTPLSIPTSRTTMPHMSLFELLFALLLVCVLVGVAAVALLAWSLTRRADGQAAAVAELRQRMETGGLTQESQSAEIRERLAQTQSVVERLGSALVARQSIEDEARSSLKRLESVIAGSSTRGAAGENILEEV